MSGVCFCTCIKGKTLWTCLCSLFFFLFLCQPYPGLWNYKLVFLILKILQYDRLRRWVQLFPRYPCKKWYLLFYKTYDHRIWLAGTCTGFDSSETNQTGAGDVITSRSCGKPKTLYLHYQGLYGYQTWSDGNLPWWAPAHKVKWPFDHVVLWNHVTNYNRCISTTIVPMASKLGRMVTYDDELLPVKSHDPLVTLSWEITWQTKIIISPLM